MAGGEDHTPYRYMQQLSVLQGYCPPSPHQLAGEAAEVSTPLNLEAWQEALAPHPDQAFAGYITQGIAEGFRIGFDYEHHRCRKATSNLVSTVAQPQVVGGVHSKRAKLGATSQD